MAVIELLKEVRAVTDYSSSVVWSLPAEDSKQQSSCKGKRLDDFISFCKPSLEFLEKATDYEMILTIWHYKKQYDVLYYRD